MNIDRLKPIFENKRCVILGFGREGKSWLSLLQKLDCAEEIAVADMNEISGADGCALHIGADYLERCKDYDLILQSPGVAIKKSFSDSEKAKIVTQTDVLLSLKPCMIIGVTGTKGKSTTSALIHHFLSSCGIKTMLIGNIGVPPLERLPDMAEDTVVVCEMSCHQLEFARHSPDISVLLNIYPEHLDHYVDFSAYAAAKENIYLHQNSDNIAIINSEISAKPFAGRLISASFGSPAEVCSDDEKMLVNGIAIPFDNIHTHLRGKHNYYNIAVALQAAILAGANMTKCLESLPDFRGLPHRLEYVTSINGVEYINDSICTIPEAVIAAITAFNGADCLIIGGMDRGIPYNKLTDFLNKGSVKNIILLPDSGERISKSLTNPDLTIVHASDLTEAVKFAYALAKQRVILCPAAASYGFYKNFEERGEHFKQLVLSYK